MVARGRPSAEVRFWLKVRLGESAACWEWIGTRNPSGHGRLWVGGRLVIASRFAWELLVGPIPDGLHVLHRCDNGSCVNPKHLELGTIADNNRQARERGRWHPNFGPSNGRWRDGRWANGRRPTTVAERMGANR